MAKATEVIPRRGDVFLVSLDPTVRAEIKKTRPAVVIQNDPANRRSPITIVAAITSQFETPLYPTEVLVRPPEGGLTVDSVVLLNQVRSVDKGRLVVGWNPPRPFGGFWAPETSDNLRTELHWILNSLGAVEAVQPGEAFLDEFRRKGLFFIHAVKCWTRSRFPEISWVWTQPQKGRSRSRGIAAAARLCADAPREGSP